MSQLNQPNLITRHEIHTRTELWKDKIYYISNNPYWNKDYQFLPLPRRFAEILAEFREAVDKQKASETSEEARQEAQQTISNIYQTIRELIEEEIEMFEVEGIDFEPGTIITEEQKKELEEYEKNQQQRIKQLKLGLNKKTISQLRRFNEEHIDYSQYQITILLDQWETNKKIVDDRKNICFILQDTQDTFQFCYQPPRGNFPALTDFLWNRNNIWYETTNWQRINHENAIITAKRSHFIHNYPKFFSQGGNGVLHHSPKFGHKDEICQCPSFLESTTFKQLTSDWQPEYKLFKLNNFQGTSKGTLTNARGTYPVFHTLDVSPIDLDDFLTADVRPTSFFLLPSFYSGGICSARTFSTKFIGLDEWIKNAKMERESDYEHLLKHVNVNYFWGSKKIHESTLDEMNLETGFKIEVRANPAGIMYRFISNKVLFRYSEDLSFTLDADQLERASRNMLVKGATGALKFFTAGIVDGEEALKQEAGLNEATKNYLHSGKADKSKDERQSERKKTLASAGVNAVSSVLGSIPSLLDASHTHGNYSLAELALRFDSIQFHIRIEMNDNLAKRYQEMKGLKKNGNQPFNTKKIGNIFAKGYFKIVPNIFQGDKNGFFAGIFSRGVYLYEKHPDEYFLEPLESGEFKSGILNTDQVSTNTTIQTNYKSSIGRDNQTDVDGMSWVRKDSYCRPVGGGGTPTCGNPGCKNPNCQPHGGDLFPKLIEAGRKYMKLDVPNHSESNCKSYTTYNGKSCCTKAHGASWRFDASASWSSDPVPLKKGVKYDWYIHAFSSGQKDNKQFRGLDDGVKVILKQDGDTWELAFVGTIEITETIGNPDAIGSGVEIDDYEEVVPEMEDESMTEGLGDLEQSMEPEEEQQQQLEVQEEQEPEPEAQKQDEKQEELEQEEEKTKQKTKEKQRQKQKQKQKEDEEQQEPENSREGEK
jgi:hypothetical protein